MQNFNTHQGTAISASVDLDNDLRAHLIEEGVPEEAVESLTREQTNLVYDALLSFNHNEGTLNEEIAKRIATEESDNVNEVMKVLTEKSKQEPEQE